MNVLNVLANSVQPFAAAAHGAERGVQAYSRASDAYATLSLDSPVALWALGIAGAVVFVEWLLARTGRRR
jgi:hypothetical protein